MRGGVLMVKPAGGLANGWDISILITVSPLPELLAFSAVMLFWVSACAFMLNKPEAMNMHSNRTKPLATQ